MRLKHSKLYFILLITLVFGSAFNFLYASCDNDFKLKLKGHHLNWMVVNCENGTEYLTAPDGYKWLEINSSSSKFYADLRHISGSFIDEVRLTQGNEFLTLYEKRLVYHEIDNLNEMLSQEISASSDYEDIVIMRILTSGRTRFELFLFLKNEIPEFIIACVGYCNNFPPLTFRVFEK